MQRDAFAVRKGRLAWNGFVEKYGHLRPGTFDILSPTYREEAELILRPMVAGSHSAQRARPSHWNASVCRRLAAALADIGLRLDAASLEQRLREAIEAREWSKFHFSKNLSHALDALAGLEGWSRDDLSHAGIGDFHALRSLSAVGAREYLRAAIETGRRDFERMQAICLPSQLSSPDDFRCFEQPPAEPNFVTRKTVRAPTRLVRDGSARTFDGVEGTIVILPNADPGYDWLFARGIAGLATMYGGVNSHMAIRAAGFGLPAAIGVGENLFERISRARVLEINCAARQISIIDK